MPQVSYSSQGADPSPPCLPTIHIQLQNNKSKHTCHPTGLHFSPPFYLTQLNYFKEPYEKQNKSFLEAQVKNFK